MNGWALSLSSNGAVRSIDPGHACTMPPEGQFTWVHLDGKEAETNRWLQQHGHLPETVVAALTAVETRPRSEAFANGALVNLRGLHPEGDHGGDPLVSIRLWAERGRVISVSFRPLDGFEHLRAAMEDAELHDPGDLISALAILITAKLDPHVADLGDLVDSCEADFDADRAYEMRRLIARARSQAIAYRRFVVPQRQALEGLAIMKTEWLEEADRLHLREAADRFARMGEELEAVRERSALLHEQFTDLRAEQIETRTLVLSVVALVFLPLTFLTGLLGMNVAGIPFAHEPWAFAAVVGMCVAVAAAIAVYFVRAHWFRN
ncbi:zinc transporter ZntB [Sphingomonas naphthae]|uniref:Zinc transporter ZntB n=1 Tax=Sphingomonas naphthae TaxID=1813468 RepID=A0ABY7TLD0_9SPHN|nr:zinc transporter ZntB [Sphingomonas naphthae]WCT73755.1 zinc transporter ZntB [Sphingomonas naphthae]